MDGVGFEIVGESDDIWLAIDGLLTILDGHGRAMGFEPPFSLMTFPKLASGAGSHFLPECWSRSTPIEYRWLSFSRPSLDDSSVGPQAPASGQYFFPPIDSISPLTTLNQESISAGLSITSKKLDAQRLVSRRNPIFFIIDSCSLPLWTPSSSDI